MAIASRKPEDIARAFAVTRKRFLSGVAVLGVIAFVAYGVVNIFIGDYGPAYFELALGGFLVVSIILLSKEKTTPAAFVIGALVITIISIHNFGTGGFSGTGPFWVFMFPAIIFVLQGARRGLIWLGALFAAMLVILWLRPFPDYYILPYDNFSILMFLAVLAVVSGLMYFYQRTQEKNEKIIITQAEKLSAESIDLQRSLEEKEQALQQMSEQQKEVEKLNRLMVGREIRMKELKSEIDKLKDK